MQGMDKQDHEKMADSTFTLPIQKESSNTKMPINCNSFRRRKRKQESEKIHRTILDSDINLNLENGVEIHATPGKTGDKISPSSEDVEMSSRDRSSLHPASSHPENQKSAALQHVEEAYGDNRHNCEDNSMPADDCFTDPLDLSKQPLQNANTDHAEEVRKQLKNTLMEFLSDGCHLKGNANTGDAWELYRGLLCKIIQLLSQKYADTCKSDIGVLQEALLMEHIGNEQLRAEQEAMEYQLTHVLSLAEKGSKASQLKILSRLIELQLATAIHIEAASSNNLWSMALPDFKAFRTQNCSCSSFRCNNNSATAVARSSTAQVEGRH